jgi:DNA polymerase III delta subunit
MIYLLYGDNIERGRAVLRKFRARFEREARGAWRYIDCEDDDIEDLLRAEIGATSLFSDKDFIIIEHASTLPEKEADVFVGALLRWAGDDSVVICYERGVPKNKIFSRLLEIATKKEEFKSVETRRRPAPQDGELFALGDLWGTKAHKASFIKYHQLLDAGFDPENILRTLFWHVKNVTLAAHGKGGEIKSSFVAGKAARQAQNFSPEMLADSLESLARMSDLRAKDTLDTRLVRFLLTG